MKSLWIKIRCLQGYIPSGDSEGEPVYLPFPVSRGVHHYFLDFMSPFLQVQNQQWVVKSIWHSLSSDLASTVTPVPLQLSSASKDHLNNQGQFANIEVSWLAVLIPPSCINPSVYTGFNN